MSEVPIKSKPSAASNVHPTQPTPPNQAQFSGMAPTMTPEQWAQYQQFLQFQQFQAFQQQMMLQQGQPMPQPSADPQAQAAALQMQWLQYQQFVQFQQMALMQQQAARCRKPCHRRWRSMACRLNRKLCRRSCHLTA